MARDTKEEFLKQIEAESPKIARAFREAIEDMRDVAKEQALVEAIERRDVEAILRILNLSREFFYPLDVAINSTFMFAANFQFAVLPQRIPGEVLAVRFDGRHPRAVNFARDRAAVLLTEVTDDTRQAVRDIITAGAETSTPPRVLARQIVGTHNPLTGKREGGIVGLTAQQAGFVTNMRAQLADPALMAGYFERKRRDRRFDPIVTRAMREGRAVAPADIEKIVKRYADRLLALRGETIGRTEALRALNAGKNEGVLQLVERGEVPMEAVTKTWKATPSDRTRDSHWAMNGQTKPLLEPYVTPGTKKHPGGALMMYPGDTSFGAPGYEVINCRCSSHAKIDWPAVADWRERNREVA